MTTITFRDKNYRYGFNISKKATFKETIEYILKNTPYCNFQISLADPKSKEVSNYDIPDLLEVRNLLDKMQISMFIHGCLRYSLCGAPNHKKDSIFDSNIKNTCDGLSLELDIAASLGCGGIVVHPNSCHNVEKGLFTASKVIESVLTKNTVKTEKLAKSLNMNKEEFKKCRRLLLENSAHEGGKRGWNLDELGKMISELPENLRCQVGICIDTAHAFGAGVYDFGKISDIEKFYKEFEEKIGLDKLWLFHLNDSMKSIHKREDAFFGSRKDRHANLGDGYIFSDDERKSALKEFFLKAYKHRIPIIGEPPALERGGKEGIHDWDFVCELLLDSPFPLEVTEEIN